MKTLTRTKKERALQNPTARRRTDNSARDRLMTALKGVPAFTKNSSRADQQGRAAIAGGLDCRLAFCLTPTLSPPRAEEPNRALEHLRSLDTGDELTPAYFWSREQPSPSLMWNERPILASLQIPNQIKVDYSWVYSLYAALAKR